MYKFPKKDNQQKTFALMKRLNFTDMAKRYPSQISGGQQQRVALARALAVEPEVLLLDEPFSALDNHLKNHLMKDMQLTLKEFKGNALFVTHNMEESYRLCDHIAVLNAGQVETFASKEEVFLHPVSLETAQITGCKNIAAAQCKSTYTAEVPAWGITLHTDTSILSPNGFVGIRANHIMFAESAGNNCFPVWIADESRSPFRTTLYLKIGSAANGTDDYHIQWEISREQREKISKLQSPFYVFMDPGRVFFVEN
jgi:ABC-type sulfate/molybdate transport systems ATPase subunit